MSKFDTHGGYFAPKDYMRVNEGGSHEENPNGGVQVGVDPEGNPNLLEEGEPVYKDYVYSDNIEAEEKFLVDNNLPKKYAGKLYSKIADELFSEAEERPLDPISNNGLEVLLGRLADAQEAQKQEKEQRELENELANLSPEELDQLEAMLAQEQSVGTDNPLYSEGPVGEQGEPGIPPEQMGPAMPVEQGMMKPVPGMGCGGHMSRNKYEIGGPIKTYDELASEILAESQNAGRASGIGNTDYHLVVEHPEMNVALMAAQPGTILEKALAPSIYRGMAEGLANGDASFAVFNPFRKISGLGKAKYLEDLSESIYKGERWNKVRDIQKTLIQRDSELEKLATELDKAKKANNHTLINDIKSKIRTQEFAKKGDLSSFNKEYGTASELEPIVRNTPESKPQKNIESKPVKTSTEETGPSFWKAVRNPLYGAGKQTAKALEGKSGLIRYPAVAAAQLGQWGSGYAMYGGVDKALDTWKSPFAGEPSYEGGDQPELDFGDWEYARGGKLNKFDGGGWAEFLKRLADYGYSKNPAAVAGKYAIDRRADVWGGRTAEDIEADKAYQDFTNYVIANSDNADVRNYLRALDAGVAEGTPLLFDGDNLVNGWEKLFRDRRTDGDLGIYHLNPDNIDFSNRFVTAVSPDVPAGFTPLQSADTRSVPFTEAFPGQYLADTMYRKYAARQRAGLVPVQEQPVSGGANDEESDIYEGNPGLLPTWPRYAGAIGSGLLGLYNVFQSPDRYTQTRLNPQLPEGRINLQNQVYNPVDQNMIANSISAQGNATTRALRNSGLGPSSASAILAADNNTTGNLGTGFLQTWDANNQRRNAVITANNQAEAQRANFDWTVDAARKQILNDTAYRNAYNDLMTQRLNYAAEGDKYQAISNQISNGLQALSGIGKENFAMNQINTNPAFLGYGVGPNGGMYYNPMTRRYERIAEEEPVAKKTVAPVNTALKPVPTFGFNPNPKYSNDPFMGYNKGIDLTFNPLFPKKKKN